MAAKTRSCEIFAAQTSHFGRAVTERRRGRRRCNGPRLVDGIASVARSRQGHDPFATFGYDSRRPARYEGIAACEFAAGDAAIDAHP